MKKNILLYIINLQIFIFIFLILGCSASKHDVSEKLSYKINYDSLTYYEKNWLKVDSLLEMNRVYKALEIIEINYNRAKSEDNIAEYVKSIILKTEVRANIDSINEQKGLIKYFEEELLFAPPVVSNILHGLIAGLYWEKFKNNRDKVNMLIQPVMMKTEYDMDHKNYKEKKDTTDYKKLIEKVIYHYNASLENAENLQNIKIDVLNKMLKGFQIYDKLEKEPPPILIQYRYFSYGLNFSKAKNFFDYYLENNLYCNDTSGRPIRPTVYDYLANNALNFFTRSEHHLVYPSEQFLLKDDAYFSNAENFINIPIETADSLSFLFHSIKIYRELLNFNLKGANPDALIEVDLSRLKFVYDNTSNPGKETLFLNALINIENKYAEHPATSNVSFLKALYYYLRGDKYAEGIYDSYKMDYKTAYDICTSTINNFPNSPGAVNCKALLDKINEKSISLKIDNNNIPKKEISVSVKYSNVNELFFRILTANEGDLAGYKEKGKEKNNEEYNGFIKYISEKKSIKEFSAKLPKENDFREHSTEIKIPSLPIGNYILIASPEKSFKAIKNIVYYTEFNVSSMVHIYRTNEKNESDEFFILDRETGEPLKNINAQIYKYKSESRNDAKAEIVKGPLLKTDENGYLELKKKTYNYNYYVVFIKNGEEIKTNYIHNKKDNIFDNSNPFELEAPYRQNDNEVIIDTNSTPSLIIEEPLVSNVNAKEQENYYIYFFTDRIIYRPGQTIFFKGIVLEKKEKEYFAVTSKNIKVNLTGPNSTKISSLTLITNDFGTISGTFVSPVNTMLGSYNISSEECSGIKIISIEEYKSPKFYVSLDNPLESYSFGDEIVLKGNAKTFSETNVNGAKVKYYINRNISFPHWLQYEFNNHVSQNYKVIKSDTTLTDNNGEYEIKFNALFDSIISKKSFPIFSYTINVEVTDISGETHSCSKTVKIGFHSLDISLSVPANIRKGLTSDLSLNVTNLNGVEQKASGKIIISKLKPPEKPFSEYQSKEKDFRNWQVENVISEFGFKTPNDKIIKLEEANMWPCGKYKVEASTMDDKGNIVTDVAYFTLYDIQEKNVPYPVDNIVIFEQEKKFPYQMGNDVFFEKDIIEPGGFISLIIGTGYNNLNIIYEIEINGLILDKKILKLNNEQKIIQIPVTEQFRGNAFVNMIYVKDNKIEEIKKTLMFPINTIDITFESFRNKLEAGEEEEWIIKIKGKNGEKVDAEMVAVLYDASLDELKKNYWGFDIREYNKSVLDWKHDFISFSSNNFFSEEHKWNGVSNGVKYGYDELSVFGSKYYYNIESFKPVLQQEQTRFTIQKDSPDKYEKEEKIAYRTNFNETAFFYPELRTDDNGDVIVKFKIPESLTKWKMLGFAHTKDLKYGFIENSLVTQKTLMVNSYLPRFFRSGDKVNIKSKITNISENNLSGTAQLNIIDAVTGKSLNNLISGNNSYLNFTADKNISTAVNWEVTVPEGIEALTYRISAKSGNYTDGEEMTIPVLSNKSLVTESMPFYIYGNETKNYKLDKLIENKSSTLENYKLTLEVCSKPVWQAVQSLPYLMEFPHECSEQLFSRFYANALAEHILLKNPKIKSIYDKWMNNKSDELLSSLEKNQDLKSVLLEETPWFKDAKSDSERKRRLGNLMQYSKIKTDITKTANKIDAAQDQDGGFPWFKNMKSDRYITQHIIAGFGKLNRLQVKRIKDSGKIKDIIKDAIRFTDNKLIEDYNIITNTEDNESRKVHINNLIVHDLYARSFFPEISKSNDLKDANKLFLEEEKKYWPAFSKYTQGMIALTLFREGEKGIAMQIVDTLRKYAVTDKENGMHWNEFSNWGYYWYEAPIEFHTLMIELFDEAAKDKKAVDDIRLWILKKKHAQDWQTTKATVEACYALLLIGSDWISDEISLDISIGNINVDSLLIPEVKEEASTGYFKTSWSNQDVKPEMGNMTVSKKNNNASWGALYWQYYEQLDKLTKSETSLKIEKKLFIKKENNSGTQLIPVNENTELKVGDYVITNIRIDTDRDLEYIHLKDMRASGFEPLNVISGNKYQDGLWFYESTRDAASHFFFSNIPKGSYVIEYPVRVTHAGVFSNGISTIQCMYAPEFSAHTEGIKVKIVN